MEFNYPSYTLEQIIGISIVMLVLALFSCLTDCFIERKKNKMEKIKLTDLDLEVIYIDIFYDINLNHYIVRFLGIYDDYDINLDYLVHYDAFSEIIDDLERRIAFEFKKFTEK